MFGKLYDDTLVRFDEVASVTSAVRKVCKRCGSTSTTDAMGQQYWGVVSKVDNQLICKECAIDELYERMFKKDVDEDD